MATKKPCPGCGKIDPKRRADFVCGLCQFKLGRYDQIEHELQQHERHNDMPTAIFDPFADVPSRDQGDRELQRILTNIVGKRDHKGRALVTKEQKDALYDLLRWLTDALNSAERKGFKKGTNILARLNTGDMSITDYDFHKQRGE